MMPVFDIPPPPPPPWIDQDDIICTSCEHLESSSNIFGDTFYNIMIIVVFVLSMLIILFTIAMFLYRKLKKKSAKLSESCSVDVSDYQLENIPKLSYTGVQGLNHQNYYSNMPTTIVMPVYESLESNHYSDLSTSLSSSSSSYQSRSSQDQPRLQSRSSQEHPSRLHGYQEDVLEPVTEL